MPELARSEVDTFWRPPRAALLLACPMGELLEGRVLLAPLSSHEKHQHIGSERSIKTILHADKGAHLSRGDLSQWRACRAMDIQAAALCAIAALDGTSRKEEEEIADQDPLENLTLASFANADGKRSGIIDDITGEALPFEACRKAKLEEIGCMQDWEVWTKTPISQAWARTGKGPLRGRWVNVNQGDSTSPNIRC